MKDLDSNTAAGEKLAGHGVEISSGAGIVWLSSCILALIASVLLVMVLFKNIMAVELFSGWSLAAVNAGIALLININAMRKKRVGFIAWGAGGNLLRFAGILVIVFLLRYWDVLKFEPFIAAFLAAYFVFMIGETVRMNVINFRSMQGR